MRVWWRAGALPRGASRRVSVPNFDRTLRTPNKEGSGAPKFAGRNADPLARLTATPVPPAGGNCRPITRTGAPLGAPLAFSLDLGTAFWKRTGAAFTERP